jgi:hypothetical protein
MQPQVSGAVAGMKHASTISDRSGPSDGMRLSVGSHKPLVSLGLWRGRRDSNPRPLP